MNKKEYMQTDKEVSGKHAEISEILASPAFQCYNRNKIRRFANSLNH